MQDIQKFLSDVQKIKKHDRADNGGHYDGKRVCKQIVKLFENNNRGSGELPRALTFYWMNNYILSSPDITNEPTEENLSRLTAMQSFLDGDDQNLEILNDDDWSNIKDSVDSEAEDIPLDTLQSMMSIILEKGRL